MADVTISSLPLGTPSGNVRIPFSNGSSTLTTTPSGIIAAGVTPGTILQTVYGQDDNQYNFANPGNNVAPINQTSTLSISLKSIASKVIINAVAYGYAYVGTDTPGFGLWLLYDNNSITPKPFYLYTYQGGNTIVSGTISIIGQHTPGVLNPIYKLGFQKASLAGTTNIAQIAAYWTIQEIAQ